MNNPKPIKKQDKVKSEKNNKKSEDELDRELEDTFPASDPVNKY